MTTNADWSVLRTAPSPWAELEFDNIILTVPSDAVRDLGRPDELAVFWNNIMTSIADLAAKPHKFPRKERFVTDVQISHGKCILTYVAVLNQAWQETPKLYVCFLSNLSVQRGISVEVLYFKHRACYKLYVENKILFLLTAGPEQPK